MLHKVIKHYSPFAGTAANSSCSRTAASVTTRASATNASISFLRSLKIWKLLPNCSGLLSFKVPDCFSAGDKFFLQDWNGGVLWKGYEKKM